MIPRINLALAFALSRLILVLVAVLAIVALPATSTAAPAMRQVKGYESPRSTSAAVVAPFFCVGFGTTPCGTAGVTWWPLGDPVSFSVPSGTRSFTVAIVDDSGLPVRAFVSGDVVRTGLQPEWPNPVCGTSPVTMTLASGAQVVHVWPDIGLWAVPERAILPGPAECLLSPLSYPTSGTITVIFGQ